MTLTIPERLVTAWGDQPDGRAWLDSLPAVVRELQERWSLTLAAPFGGDEGQCAWVAPATRSDGTRTVLKLGVPHMEAEHEIHGLRFWAGEPTVLLLEADEQYNALLLERCEPGTALREQPEPEQDIVIAGLLQRVWRVPAPPHPFRPLAAMTRSWADEALEEEASWPDPGLVCAGIQLFDELSRPAAGDVLLATDLHAGNVLRATREPWLVIDPKPFVGDPAYDATQHLFNCEARLHADPLGLIRRFAGLLGLDVERVRLWTFARAAVAWEDSLDLARALS